MFNNRMTRLFLFGAVLLLILTAAGCGGRASGKTTAIKLDFETVKQGKTGFPFMETNGRRPEYHVFRTRDEWVAFWKKSEDMDLTALEEVEGIDRKKPYVDPDPYSEQLAPIVYPFDFRDYDMMVGVFFREGAGYNISVSDVLKYPDKIVVKVKGETFDDDQPGILAQYQLVKFKNYDLPVVFHYKDDARRMSADI